jgi:hypothetical protein
MLSDIIVEEKCLRMVLIRGMDSEKIRITVVLSIFSMVISSCHTSSRGGKTMPKEKLVS